MKSSAERSRGIKAFSRDMIEHQHSGLESELPTVQTSHPATEYRQRLDRFEQSRASAAHRYRQLGNARLATGVAAVAIAAAALGGEWISAWWLLLPVMVFAALAIVHHRVDRELVSATRGVAHYQRALARVENRWAGTGASGEALRPPDHLYADDLDIFGRGSLFELLCTARTATGERTLAGWLLAPAPREAALARQRAVTELRPRIDLREQMALLGEDIRAAVDDRTLAAWGAAPPIRFFKGARAFAIALAAAALVTFVLYFSQTLSVRPFLYVILAEAIFGFTIRPQVGAIAASVNLPARELRLLGQMLERLENEALSSPALDALRTKLSGSGPRPTQQIQRLERWVERLDWTRNQFFRLIAAPLQWTTLCAMAIEDWRAQSGADIAQWVAAIGEFEALLSLAGFAYERPAATFPELLDTADPDLEFITLVHPLIAPDEAVPNDVALGGELRLWMVSGSNMSGKSTLLRAVGLAAVMAWAGAPVTAARARLSQLEVGASLRNVDSLADHRSRFYAEITRLRRILDLTRARKPTLFLLDELLSGTNSQDRRLGASALLRGLVDRGAIGLATTHDLALASIVDELGPRAANVHLEDHMEGGEMHFDYRLRPGVVERGNALALMRAVGLEV
jgi:hypothetical protein